LGVTATRKQQPSRRTQAQRRAESEQRLVHAFAELVLEKGLAETSLAEISRRAGYSATLVHHLFGSKSALLNRLTETAEQFAREQFSTVTTEPAGVALLAGARTYLELVADQDHPYGRVLAVLSSEAVSGTTELREWQRAWDSRMHALFADQIRGGIADGSITAPTEPEKLAVFIVGLLRGVARELMTESALSLASAQALVIESVSGILGITATTADLPRLN
jgi:AcrR family transcriptional regulator